ncbi:hypothetical protein M9H77_21908 [Catharanthus roseus]|uniref:Uncharacterized protein n=1 Tax=Catharanthus roseus TaxID=4058 RepID=A0ACC0AQQ0_CATRO|nr:hypothetical protein M9H77_21908 [Catharanthus roseus]
MDSRSFNQPAVTFELDEDNSVKHKANSLSSQGVASENLNGCFDCNICLDSAQDPVVTLCGHLYCWPCIYKWLEVQSSSPDSDEQTKCPVCKAYISNSSLVPLYGRGMAPTESESKKHQLDLVVPRRPPALGVNTITANTASISSPTQQQQLHPNLFHPQPESYQQQQYLEPQLQAFHQQPYFPNPFSPYASTGPSAFGNMATTSFFSPTIVMFGEMVFPGMFPNSYPPSGNGSPRRIRRQELQVEKSLSRVNYFLFFCLLLCLLLF